MRVKLYAPLSINLTGYDRVPAVYPAGELEDAPPQVVSLVLRHPELGAVVEQASTRVSSHSDQDVDEVGALVDAIDGLTVQQAQAIIAAGFTLQTLPLSRTGLVRIKGIGPATADRILEARQQ